MTALQRLRLIVGRAKVNRVNDKTKLQRLQVSALADEVRDDVPRMQNFGQTGNPMPGSQAIVVAVGGSRDGMVAVAVDDPASRPTGLKPGESATYNAHGVLFRYLDDGRAVLECDQFIVIAKKVLFDAPESEFTGDVLIKGKGVVTQSLTSVGPFAYQSGMTGLPGSGGGKTTISGPVEQSGGPMSSNGITVNTHTHVDSRGGNTSGPQ